MSSDPIRVGLVGCGAISSSHLKAYKRHGMVLVAVCDLDRACAERCAAASEADPAVLSDFRELVGRDDIDLVTVATPVSVHAPVTIAALQAGKHVVCEKPSALTLEENVAIRDAARDAGRSVVFCSSRFRYGYGEIAKRYVDEGRLGRLYRVDVQMARRRGRPGIDILRHAAWFIDRRRAGGGVIMDMGQYFMDEALWLAGWPEIVAVSATEFRGFPHDLPEGTVFDVEEQATILARSREGCTFTFDLSWIGHQKPRLQVSLRGVDGGAVVDHAAGDNGQPFTYFNDGAGPWQWMNTTTDWRSKESGDERLYGDVARAIRGESVDVGTTPDQAIAITRLTLMGQRSAALGREVTADEVPLPQAALA